MRLTERKINMQQEIIATGRTIEAAIAGGAEQLGVPVTNVDH